jgi:hypothetical protein
MSDDQISSEVTVYVLLLDEGTEVFRPTEADPCGTGLYRFRITPDYDPDDESWEFPPGTLEKVEERRGGNFLLAVRAII